MTHLCISMLNQTKSSHSRFLKSGHLFSNSIVQNFIDWYCQSSDFKDARQLFDEMPDKDIVSCTSVIGIFSKHGRVVDAIHVFSIILQCNVKPNQFTFGTLIHLFTSSRDIIRGKQLHSCAMKMGLCSDVFVGSAMLDMHAKLGSIEDASKSFREIQEPNVVCYTGLVYGYLKNGRLEDALDLFQAMPEKSTASWNAVISGCSQMGENEKALSLFVGMCRNGEDPNSSTFTSVFSAVGNMAAVGIGRHVHAYLMKSLCIVDVFLGNSLISFYAKCGVMEESRKNFYGLKERNVVSWNALISGYANNGGAKKALEVYEEMKKEGGVRPNRVTLLCVLFACSHAGFVNEGLTFFELAKHEHPGFLRAEHYACMVDMLSRSRKFCEAEAVLKSLPFDPGIGFWKALIGGCQVHGNKELAELIARKIHGLDPEDASSYVLLCNVYAATDNWRAVSDVRRVMKDIRMKRIPGCSWIEIKRKVHTFVTRDKEHPQSDDIYAMLRDCYQQRREPGHSPDMLVDHHNELQ